MHHVCILPGNLVLPGKHQRTKPRSLVHRSDMQPREASSRHAQALLAYPPKPNILLTSAVEADVQPCPDRRVRHFPSAIALQSNGPFERAEFDIGLWHPEQSISMSQ
ncbi:hypothetical protein PMIN07_010298 [Paraphaeosphaeria minitans]